MLSDFFTEDELLSQLRLHFEYDEMFDFDFTDICNNILEREDDYLLRFRGRQFSIDKLSGLVKEV